MATLKFRRGTSFTSPQLAEPFFNTNSDTLQVGDGSSNITLLKIGENDGNVVVSGSIEVTQDLTIGGNLYLGDNIADNIVISAELSSSLIPNNNDAFDLGSDTKRWSNLYAVSASIQNVDFPGSGLVSSSQQVDDFGFLKVLGDSVVSGSEQITDVLTSLNSYTASNDTTNTTQNSRLDQLSTETGSISTEQANQDTRLDQLSTETGSISTEQALQDTRLNQLASATGSYLTSTGSVDYSDITSVPAGIVSGSIQILGGSDIISSSEQITDFGFISSSDSTTSLNSYTASNDINISNIHSFTSSNENTSLNTFTASNGNTSLNSYTSSNDINITNIHSTTASFESRLDFLSNASHSHANKSQLDTINQNLSTTSDVTFNTGSFTGNMTITGDLTVLGSSTEISSTELRIEDKLITVASGSADSAAADGAGLEIDGAGKSLTWDHNTSQFVLDAKVSSSVGFKGEGGELTGIDTDQVTEATNKYYTDARVKQKMTNEVAHSGSFLGTATTSNLTEGTNLYWTETRFSSSLDARGVISGSSQITITESQISDLSHTNITSLNSYTASNDTTNTTQNSRLDQLSTETGSITTEQTAQDTRIDQLASETGSYLTSVDISTDTNLAVSDTTNVDMILTGDTLSANLTGGVISGSAQLSGTFLSKLGDGVLSSSAFSSPSQGTVRATINGVNTDVDTGLQSADSPSFNGLSLSSVTEVDSGEYSALFVSSSNLLGTRELGTSAFLHYSNSIADGNSQVIGTAQATKNYIDAQIIEAGSGDITEVLAGLGMSGGAQTGSATLTLDTGSSHFTTAVNNLGGGNTTSLNAYTASNDINITNIHSTTASLEQRVGQIESNTGSYDDQTVITSLNAFTASNGNDSLNSYTASNDTTNTTQNSRLDQLSTETGSISTEQALQDTRLNQLASATGSYLTSSGSVDYSDITSVPAGIVSGSSQISHDDTTGFVANEHIDHSTITIGSGQGLSGGGTINVSRSITLDTGSTHFVEGVDNRLESLNSYTSSNNTDITSIEGRLDNIESNTGSYDDQTVITSLNSYTASNDINITNIHSTTSSFDQRLDSLEGESGSYLTTVDISSDTNLAVSDTSEVNMILTGDTLSAELIGGVVSGSSQINLASATGVATSASFAETASLSTYTAEWILGANGASDYTFTGPGHLTGSNDPALYLVRGQQYKFTNNSGGHPFRIQSTPNGSAGTQYNNGVTNQDANNGTTLFFDVPMNAPETLYYQCTSHGSMGGPIYIVDSNSIDGRLDTLEGESHENPLTFNDTSTINLVRSTNTITAHAIGGVVSGSGQISLGAAAGTVDISSQTNLAVSDTSEVNMILTGDTISAELIGGVVSGSSQITNIANSQLAGSIANAKLANSAITISGTSVSLGGSITDETLFGGTGVISGSSQVSLSGFDTDDLSEGSSNLYYTDARVKTKLDAEGVLSGSTHAGNQTFSNNVTISGDLDVAGTTTYTSTNNVNIGDNILELNFGGSATTGGILVKDATGTTTSGSLLWDASNDYWTAGALGSEVQIALVNGTYSGLRAQSTTKGDVGLGNVENTALSTWGGSTNITSLGTISTGTWQGSVITSAYLDSDTAHLSGTQTFSGAKSFSSAVNIDDTTQSTSKTTGALIVDGGVGIVKTLNVGEDVVAYASSDERLKNNIQPISNPLEKINQISGNSFVWNEEKQNIYKGKDYGVIAQEIENILPELVETRESGYKAVKYEKLVSLLIEGIKELSKEVEELKNK